MTSTSRAYFEAMYADTADPWHFATSDYERRKYALTTAALPREHYRNAFEPGCSIGVLSELLAPRCDRLLATDIVADALVQARERLRPYPHVSVEERYLLDEWPREKFDLIVLSEVAYYFDDEGLAHILRSIFATSDLGAHVLGVHWRGATDYPQRGDDVHDRLSAAAGLGTVVHHVEEAFRLDVWERVS